MTRRTTSLLMIVALLCVVPLLLANANYRFTFDNPSVGEMRAPFTLEYFSMTECPSCREFEKADIASLEPLIESGQLRIIYRDLPSFSHHEMGLRLFCLQEYDDYLGYRRAAKVDPDFTWHTLPVLHGRAMARHQQCLTTEAAPAIHRHNRIAFDRRGFEATPAFTLVFAADRKAIRTHWTGRPSVPAFFQTMNALRSSLSGEPAH